MESTNILALFVAAIAAMGASLAFVVLWLRGVVRGSQRRCDSENAELRKRVDRLEDFKSSILEGMARDATEALRENVRWFKRFFEANDLTPPSGVHRGAKP